MRREFERAALPASLQAIRDFVEDACRQSGVEKAAAHGLVLAVDEACTNVIEHARMFVQKSDKTITLAPF